MSSYKRDDGAAWPGVRQGPRPSLDDIVTAACMVGGITRCDFIRECHYPAIVYVRRLAAGVGRLHGYSYPHMGRAFQRDHTTVLYGLKKVRRLRAEGNEQIDRDLELVNALASSYAAERIAPKNKRAKVPA